MQKIIDDLLQVGGLKNTRPERPIPVPRKIKAAMIRKPTGIGDLVARLKSEKPQPETVTIVETIELSWGEFKAFGDDFTKSYPWLAGKRGAIEVLPPEHYPISFIVNSEGYDYPRYVGFEAADE